MMNHRFYKEEDNKWYIDIPFDGSKAELEMVAGADVLLDFLAEGDTSITLSLFPVTTGDIVDGLQAMKLVTGNYMAMSRVNEVLDAGQTYACNYNGTPEIIWLCDVTKHVFGEFPEVIFFKKVKKQ